MKRVLRAIIARIKGIVSIVCGIVIRTPGAIVWAVRLFFRKVGIDHSYDYLHKFKDLHKGEKAFFVGTGPSLTIEDVEMLKGNIVFGVNSLIDSADKLSYQLTYYCLADKRAVSLFYDKVVVSKVKNIFVGNGRLSKSEIKSDNTMRFPDMRDYLLLRNIFSEKRKLKVTDDISIMVYDGGTVIFSAMQIAAYMGIKEMYLLGVDCNYAKGVKNFNEFRPENEIQLGGNEKTQLGAFIKFKEYADAHDIKVYNATRGGALEVFPRVNLEDIVG